MARTNNIGRVLAEGTVALVVALLATACETSQVPAPAVKDPARLGVVEGEVLRLTARINALESQLRLEHKNAARARQETQEQRERLAALENQIPTPAADPAPSPPAASTATTMQAEAELRAAYRALMRAIERMDISAEEKAAIKSSLRPTRTLDHDNPWSIAKY
jgi:hypothetical protein